MRVPWLLLKFPASSQDADMLADALSANGALSVSIESADGEQRLQAAQEHTPLWRANRVTGLFPANADTTAVVDAVRHTLGAGAPLAYEIDRLDDADWGRAWMADYRPQPVAANLWIIPSWCTPPDPSAVNVVLDPGLAFGTGTHPTTRLCLEWLAALPLAQRTILDYGCGSAILAIAALKLGAARAIGVDIDPHALAASRTNAARNGVAERFVACTPQALPADATADVVVANILSATLIALAPELLARLRPHGWLGLSGIVVEQRDEVRTAFAPSVKLAAHERDGWLLLAGQRKR